MSKSCIYVRKQERIQEMMKSVQTVYINNSHKMFNVKRKKKFIEYEIDFEMDRWP